MSEPQLERSVLEAKERDELHAIAEALGTKPGSRTKKADLISQILKATGVEADAPEPAEKPRRTRARKATATAQPAAVGNGTEPNGDADATTTATATATADGSAEGEAQQLPLGDTRPTSSRSRTAAARSALTDTATGSSPVGPTRARGSRSATPRAPADAAATNGSATAATGADTTGSDDTGSGNTGSGNTGSGNTGSGNTVPESPATASNSAANGTDLRQGRSADTGPGDQARSSGQASQSGPSRSAGQPGGSSSTQSGPGQGNHGPASSQSPQTGSSSQGSPGGQPGQHSGNNDRARFDGEPGNRRNRRRRGRDRTGTTDRPERDLQGQTPEQQQYSGDPIPVKGLLDLRDEGYGFLRTKGFLASANDVYVSISQVRRFALRKGDEIDGACRPAATNEKYPALLRIDTVTGLSADEARQRPKFEDLTPLFPDEKMRLEVPGDAANMTARIVDLISPIGKGQRGLIVSPPKAGKTTVLKQIAHSIEANNPEVYLMVLLVDERPEEVTDMRRSVKGEVVASTFDRPSDEHTQVAELTIERAKRMVELGKDVVIVLDGITRLARAYNLAQPATGRIMSGGIDTGALYPPKKFFGSARNIEEGGSLTILATALVETGSRMDEVIFEEFKGTGNMELRLDRRLAERRIYPALDVNASSTRHEELLFDRTQLQQVWKLRRVLNALGSEGSDAAGLQLLMDKIKSTRSNDEFLAEIAKTPAPAI
jgi:transcription termination factor Rho